jgi:4'-phosphopantetheinyl transferase
LPLEFSLSHTRGLVVCAVAIKDAVGVDVEWPGREVAHAELARRFFAPAEADWLAELPPEEQRAAFFELWTLKEAFIKALGVGMAMPLADFAFSLSGHDSATISFAKPHGERPEEWQFHWCRLAGEYQAAVAIRRPAAQRSEIVIREAVPRFV